MTAALAALGNAVAAAHAAARDAFNAANGAGLTAPERWTVLAPLSRVERMLMGIARQFKPVQVIEMPDGEQVLTNLDSVLEVESYRDWLMEDDFDRYDDDPMPSYWTGTIVKAAPAVPGTLWGMFVVARDACDGCMGWHEFLALYDEFIDLPERMRAARAERRAADLDEVTDRLEQPRKRRAGAPPRRKTIGHRAGCLPEAQEMLAA